MKIKSDLSSTTPSIFWTCFAVLVFIITLLVIIFAFERLPIENTRFSLDWYNIYNGIKGASITYRVDHDGLRNPPWSILFILPLGLFSYRVSWGLITLMTLAVTTASVPKLNNRILYYITIFLLVLSYSSVRQLADGNVEVLVIGGVLLILYSLIKGRPVELAIGVLLTSAKVQETWLLLIICGLLTIRTWPLRRWLLSALIILGVVAGCSIWRGQEWISAITNVPQLGQGSELDISLSAFWERLNLPHFVFVLFWLALLLCTLYFSSRSSLLTREKAALLICTSMLLSPYTAGNSFLTVLAIGTAALFTTHFWIGVSLILLCNIQYLLPIDILLHYASSYTTAMLLLNWGIMAWFIYHPEKRQPQAEALRSANDLAR